LIYCSRLLRMTMMTNSLRPKQSTSLPITSKNKQNMKSNLRVQLIKGSLKERLCKKSQDRKEKPEELKCVECRQESKKNRKAPLT
jgi:hypothetical protein